MSVLKPVVYEEDLTGTHPENLITGEIRVLENHNRRLVIPYHAPFYTESFVIRDSQTGKVLEKQIDYVFIEFDSYLQMLTGKEIASGILIINKSISRDVNFDYQTFGGERSLNSSAIKNLMDQLVNDNRPVSWDGITGKPTHFPPQEHNHPINDVIGWGFVVEALHAISRSIERGDEISHQFIYKYIDDLLVNNNSEQLTLKDMLTEHINNKENPHEVTASQIGTLTETEIRVLVNTVSEALDNFKARTDNPHNVTAEQVNTYTKTQINQLIESVQTALSTLIKQLSDKLLDEDDKLKAERFKLDKHPANTLSVSNEGLLSKQSPKTQIIYVDNEVGLNNPYNDELDPRGTIDSPLQTITYAIQNYYNNENMIIMLKHGQEHVIEDLNIRGYTGSIKIRTWGDDSHEYPNYQATQYANQTFSEERLAKVVLKMKQNIIPLKLEGYLDLVFDCVSVKFVSGGNNNITQEECLIQSLRGINKLGFINCHLNTGNLVDSKELTWFNGLSKYGSVKVQFLNSLDKLTGSNPLFKSESRTNISIDVNQNNGITLEDVYDNFESYLRNKESNPYGIWYHYFMNINAKKPPVNEIIHRDGKTYAKVFVNNEWKEQQIYPALWVRESQI